MDLTDILTVIFWIILLGTALSLILIILLVVYIGMDLIREPLPDEKEKIEEIEVEFEEL